MKLLQGHLPEPSDAEKSPGGDLEPQWKVSGLLPATATALFSFLNPLGKPLGKSLDGRTLFLKALFVKNEAN